MKKGWIIAIAVILILALIGSCDEGASSNSNTDKCAVCGGSGLVNTGFIDFKTCPVCKGTGVDFH